LASRDGLRQRDTARGFALPAALLGLVWLLLGVSKAIRPGTGAAFLGATWLGGSSTLGAVAVWLIIMIELALGGLLLATACGWRARWPLVASAAFLVLLSVGVLATPRVTGCGCLGAVGTLTRGQKLLLLGAMLVLSSLAHPRRSKLAPKRAA
jgi:hypothetical protein